MENPIQASGATTIRRDPIRTDSSQSQPTSMTTDNPVKGSKEGSSRGPTGASPSVSAQLGTAISFIFRDFLKKLSEEVEKGRREVAKAKQQATARMSTPLLPPQSEAHSGRLTLVLDLDATLIDTLHMHEHGNCEPDFIYEGRLIVIAKAANFSVRGVLVTVPVFHNCMPVTVPNKQQLPVTGVCCRH